MENKIIDKFHDQRDYYVMMELVKKLKEDWCHWKECGKGSKCVCCEKIDNIFGSFDGK